jgi:hypothetical protein
LGRAVEQAVGRRDLVGIASEEIPEHVALGLIFSIQRQVNIFRHVSVEFLKPKLGKRKKNSGTIIFGGVAIVVTLQLIVVMVNVKGGVNKKTPPLF